MLKDVFVARGCLLSMTTNSSSVYLRTSTSISAASHQLHLLIMYEILEVQLQALSLD